MTRVAAIDCGTNSIRLLISEVQDDGKVRDITRTMEIIRLGEGVDATGEIAPAALDRARVALEGYVRQMKFEKVSRVRMVATSATRDAKNQQEFFDMTAELLGQIQPGAQAEVVSGEEEALLSFNGAVADLEPDRGPFCVIDLGGGSTEFVVGTADGEILGTHSARMGCVRLTERIMRTDPPTESEIEIASEYVGERTAEVEDIVPISKARTIVGCAALSPHCPHWRKASSVTMPMPFTALSSVSVPCACSCSSLLPCLPTSAPSTPSFTPAVPMSSAVGQ